VHHPTGHALARYQRRAAKDTSTALDRFSAAARTTAASARRRGSLARGRATRAVAALGGQAPPSPWRWAGCGLAAGIVIGAAAATILHHARQRPPLDDPDGPAADTRPAQMLAQARTAVTTAATTIRDNARRTLSTTPDNTDDTDDTESIDHQPEPEPADKEASPAVPPRPPEPTTQQPRTEPARRSTGR